MPLSAAFTARRKAFRAAVLRFYRRHKRDLPWRRTRDPYRILVSEIMLQQTQVDRVIPTYEAFLARFPTLGALARARCADVVRAWLGLGYNGRAVRLWQCARQVHAEHRGVLPRELQQLQRLPGVGPYTASAVAAIAFGAPVAAVDVNVGRVLSRVFAGRDDLATARVHALAHAVVPPRAAGEWAQALMDLGARYCRARPRCAECPVRTMCAYTRRHRSAIQRGRKGAASDRFHGSNRYYRGRIVRVLSTDVDLTVRALGRKVKDGFALSDVPWLLELLRGLARDGLVRVLRGRVRLA